MKTKISEIEELRLEKLRLREECLLHEQRLKERINYTKANFGQLILKSVVSSTKSGFSDLTSPLSSTEKNNTKKSSLGIGQILSSTFPFIWEIAQPLLIGLAVKKAKSLFIPKKKKK